MSKNKKSTNKKTTHQKKFILLERINTDILILSIIGLSVIWLISLFSSQMGLFGRILRAISFTSMGLGAYLFPIFIIITSLIIISKSKEKKIFNIITPSLIILLAILIILDRNNMGINLYERLKYSIDSGLNKAGGGFIGSFLGYFMFTIFGNIGTYIILSLTLFINILILINKNIKEVSAILWKKIHPEKKVRPSNNVDKKKNISNNLKKEENIQESIKILDYNKDMAIKNSPSSDLDIKNKTSKAIVNDLQGEYVFPSIDLLKEYNHVNNNFDKNEVTQNAVIIEETMKNFGIDCTISQINRGPTITCYELLPAPGIKLNKIVGLSDNIALSLASSDIRIEAPIPGKSAVGIEVPNKLKDSVGLRELIDSKEFKEIDSNIPLVLGKDVSGKIIISSIDKMPHLLIAGATGSGKSVCINTIINSIIFKSSPKKVKLLLIDPKVVELSIYNGIPHLLIPVVTEAKKAASALNWSVQEMEKRYKLFAENNVRDKCSYNSKVDEENQITDIVIIIDELADLMMVSPQEIEDYICRLAQMARAAGIYLIVATQRPSVDVITGTIKANIPSRISFSVSSQIDSRTILDMAGGEKLLGKGDMLFYPSFFSKPLRVQGAFLSDLEVEKIVAHLQNNSDIDYMEDIIEKIEDNIIEINKDDSKDELIFEAIDLVKDLDSASISLLQRKLKVGYARAARIMDELENEGVVGPHQGSKPRQVLNPNIQNMNIDNNI